MAASMTPRQKTSGALKPISRTVDIRFRKTSAAQQRRQPAVARAKAPGYANRHARRLSARSNQVALLYRPSPNGILLEPLKYIHHITPRARARITCSPLTMPNFA